MQFPTEEIRPRVTLTDEMISQAEPYIFGSMIRGLYEKKYIDWGTLKDLFKVLTGWESFEAQLFVTLTGLEKMQLSFAEDLKNAEARVQALKLPTKFDRAKFWDGDKRLGVQGEMAFHIARGADYRTVFKVANSYTFRSRYESVYPDSCVNANYSVETHCACNKEMRINVKTRCRRDYKWHSGLKIYAENGQLDLNDAVYAAIEKLRRPQPSYIIHGYALKSEVENTPRDLDIDDPRRRKYGNVFIRYADLHPLRNLNPTAYLYTVTVGDLEELGLNT